MKRKLFMLFMAVSFFSLGALAQTKPAKKIAAIKHLTVTAPRKFTFKALLANFPATAIHVISVPTDALEYVSGKVYAAAVKIDAAADAAETYLKNVQ